jgi:hypothetical protein
VPFADSYGKNFPDALNFFLQTKNLPYPANKEEVSDEYQKVNPSALKFKQCVREDLRLRNQNHFFPMGVAASNAEERFPVEERYFPEGILESNSLEEIFPMYMEYRYDLLRTAAAKGITKESALNVLAEKLPRLHDYFETDVKKVLKYRLYSYKYQLKTRHLKSKFEMSEIEEWQFDKTFQRLNKGCEFVFRIRRSHAAKMRNNNRSPD